MRTIRGSRYLLLCLMLVALLSLAACGGDEQETGTAGGDTTAVSDGTGSQTPTPGPGNNGAETTPAGPLYDLRTEDMVEPIGVDVAAPAFSWKMQSDVLGQRQTAYRIEVTAPDGTVMWDSGRQADGDSVDIPYAGQTLAASTRYNWKLTVWDKDENPMTAASTFETGLLGEAGFAGASWISYQSPTLSEGNRYSVEMDLTLKQNNFGICFCAKSRQNMLMWQFNTSESNGAKVYLRPHRMSGGTWGTFGGNIDITSGMGLSSGRELIGKPMRLRIEVNGQTVVTSIAPVGQTPVEVNRMTVEGDTSLYTIGFRGSASSNEMAIVDNILVRDGAGKTLYENDFSSGSAEDFAVDGGSAVVRNEQLTFTYAGTADVLALRATTGDSLPVFRKSFTPKGKVVSAKLYTSALGVYESYINGERVGRLLSDGTVEYHELKPGAAEAADRKYYSSYDVTHMLKGTGETVLSAVVGTGWWTGQIAAAHGSSEAYLAKLILTYEDGSTEVIGTDTTWQSAYASPFTYSDIFGGEDYDARVDLSWMKPGYKPDAAWSNVVINTEFKGEITAWMGSYIKVRDDLEQSVKSVTVYQGAKGANAARYGVINVLETYDSGSFTLNPGETALIDFGQNFAGWEAFTVKGESGTVIRVEHGEMLNDQHGERGRGCDGPGGSLYNANNRSARAATVYTMRGGASESYHPSLTYYGFRYIEITVSAPVTFERITGQVVTSVEKDTGWLETSHADINQLMSNIRWGQYSNYLSVPTDCPQRNERLGWMADTQVFARAGAYLGFSKSFLEKYMQDVRDTQNSDGAFSGIAPGDFVDGAGWGGTGWADAGIIVPYTLYTMYDDVQAIRDNWEAMERYMDYLARVGGPRNIWGDWLAYESNDNEIQNILSNVYYAWDGLMMAEMADAIGLSDKAESYRALYDQQRNLFMRRYVKPDGTVKRGEQCICLYALYLDLLPNEASVTAVTDQLISNITSKGNRLQTGFLGTKIILETLTKIGRTDVAYTLLLQTDNPSWLYSVKQGATTIWERWNSYTLETGFGDVNMNSFNHYAYGAVANWMFSTMAGIDTHPDTPGFKHLLIAPEADTRIGTVKASYDSAYGLIRAESVCTEEKWTYKFSIPANTTAELRLPMGDYSTLIVNGKAPADLTEAADGIVYVGTTDGVAVFRVLAGSFEAELAA